MLLPADIDTFNQALVAVGLLAFTLALLGKL